MLAASGVELLGEQAVLTLALQQLLEKFLCLSRPAGLH